MKAIKALSGRRLAAISVSWVLSVLLVYAAAIGLAAYEASSRGMHLAAFGIDGRRVAFQAFIPPFALIIVWLAFRRARIQ